MRYKNLLYVILAAAALLALGKVAICRADGLANTTSLYAGANGVWFDGANAPGPTLEAAGNASMSLSPHLSLVGAVGFGLTKTYVRSSGGIRVTATDVDDPNFSVGLGVQYHASSVKELGRSEWCPDVSVGLRPWPQKWPAISLTALGWYGLDSKSAGCDAGARYAFHL